jgi:menaquinone-dependent protoporphyrinogen IX oxidase
LKPFAYKGMAVEGLLRSTPAAFYPSKLFAKTKRRKSSEVLIETFIRKQLRLKAHTVTRVEDTGRSPTSRG